MKLIDADALLEAITQEKLKELFSYDSNTGLFFRIKAKGSQKAGSTAGAIRTRYYTSNTIRNLLDCMKHQPNHATN